jgi:hypothetical protein
LIWRERLGVGEEEEEDHNQVLVEEADLLTNTE